MELVPCVCKQNIVQFVWHNLPKVVVIHLARRAVAPDSGFRFSLVEV